MTYKELKEKLDTLTPEQLEDNVTVCDQNQAEFFEASDVETTKDDEILHAKHFYIILRTIGEIE